MLNQRQHLKRQYECGYRWANRLSANQEKRLQTLFGVPPAGLHIATALNKLGEMKQTSQADELRSLAVSIGDLNRP